MSATKGAFHATLEQLEPNLFKAIYSGEVNPDNPDEREIPDSHIGTSRADVKTWVEQMALGMGYTNVLWDEMPPE